LNSQITIDQLDINNVSAIILDEGAFFYHQQTNTAGYEVPKWSGNNAIYAASLWIAGIDENGILRNACTKYNSGNEYYSGPFSNTNAYSDTNYLAKYANAIWTVSKYEIDYHQTNFMQPGYVIPSSILNWPGNGDASLGVSTHLAPFIDLNANNIYEPQYGEVPDIRGDMASYVILNDDSVHTESNGNSLGVEVHIMAYQYVSNDFLNNSTFLNFRVFNRGIHSYNNFKIAMYVDADLGYYGDDYIGCDSLKDLIYTYNSDNLDETSSGIQGYGGNPPAIGVVSLNHHMQVAGYYGSSNQYPHSDPSGASEFWNYMDGRWADGSPWYYGGLGYVGSTNVTSNPTRYMFSGNPYTSQGWSEVSNNNPSGDRRMFMVLDSVGLIPADEICYDLAVIYNRQGTNLENVNGLLGIADSAKNFYAQMAFNCNQVTSGIYENEITSINVQPNPSNGIFSITSTEMDLHDMKIAVTDALGKIVDFETIQTGEKVILNLSGKEGLFIIELIVNNKPYRTKVMIVN
jgi:hypothetical protein